MSFITGVGLTAYGRHEGSSSLDLMSKAAALAIADAGLKRNEIDGVLCGYSTVAPHIMLATVFAEHFGIRWSFGVGLPLVILSIVCARALGTKPLKHEVE